MAQKLTQDERHERWNYYCNRQADGWTDGDVAKKLKVAGSTFSDFKRLYMRDFINANPPRRADGDVVRHRPTHLSQHDKPTYTMGRFPAYGKLDPTGYVSPLSHLEWPLVFSQYKWDYDYIRNYRNSFHTKHEDLVLGPRDTGKSFSVIPGTAYECANLKHCFVIPTSPGPKNKGRLFRGILQILQSKLFRSYYGDILDAKAISRSEGTMWANTDHYARDHQFIMINSWDETVIGFHTDRLHYDDPFQKMYVNEESNERLLEEHLHTFQPAYGHVGRATATMTRKKPPPGHKILDYPGFLGSQGWTVTYEPAVISQDGTWPSWADCEIELVPSEAPGMPPTQVIKKIRYDPANFTKIECPRLKLEGLLEERIRNLEVFELERQNNQISTMGNYFARDEWIEVDPSRDKGRRYFYLSCDPAFGESKQSDFTAIIVGTIINHRLWLVDGFYGRIDPEETKAKIRQFYEIYNMRNGVIEKNFWQKTILKGLKKHISPIIGVENKKNKIRERIMPLREYYKDQIIFIERTNPIKDYLLAEYLSFDQTDSSAHKKDDALDALAMLIELVKPFLLRGAASSVYTLER